MVCFDNIKEENLKKLNKYGFEKIKIKSKNEKARFIGKTTLVLYKTGKLLVQGKKESVEEVEKLIEFLGIAENKKGFSGIAIGSDESLKGDTFGGIVVAGFKANDEIRCVLKDIGVKDSKKLFNPDIAKIAQEIIEKYPNNYHIENIFPKEYNKMNIRSSVTEILNVLHTRCYAKLAKGKDKNIIHIVDLYPNCSVGNIRQTGAESKYLEVAAASVLARYGALAQIRELESKSGFFIPMGSTHVESALLEIKKKSLNPEDFVKLKFSNVVKFFESF